MRVVSLGDEEEGPFEYRRARLSEPEFPELYALRRESAWVGEFLTASSD